MGFLERAMQNPQAGQPNPARNSFATPTTSRPAATPPSPAVNTGFAGRPAAPAGPTRPMSFPPPPNITATTTPTPAPAPAPAASTPPGGGGAGPFSPVAPVITKTSTTTTPFTPPPTPAPAPTPRNFAGVPTAFDMKNLQPGEQGMTPWGPVAIGEGGKPQIQFTPESEQAYRMAVVSERKKIKLPPGFDALAESLPVIPGQSNYDPFSGKWS